MLFCPQNLSSVSSNDEICISGFLFRIYLKLTVKRATKAPCVATLLLNELKSDVARVTTQVLIPCLRGGVGGQFPRNV